MPSYKHVLSQSNFFWGKLSSILHSLFFFLPSLPHSCSQKNAILSLFSFFSILSSSYHMWSITLPVYLQVDFFLFFCVPLVPTDQCHCYCSKTLRQSKLVLHPITSQSAIARASPSGSCSWGRLALASPSTEQEESLSTVSCSLHAFSIRAMSRGLLCCTVPLLCSLLWGLCCSFWLFRLLWFYVQSSPRTDQ